MIASTTIVLQLLAHYYQSLYLKRHIYIGTDRGQKQPVPLRGFEGFFRAPNICMSAAYILSRIKRAILFEKSKIALKIKQVIKPQVGNTEID